MAKQSVSFVLILASLVILAASGNLAGVPILLLLATVTGWGVMQFGKSKPENVKKR
jgi:hypothetical protein